jgi:hypothetical protein
MAKIAGLDDGNRLLRPCKNGKVCNDTSAFSSEQRTRVVGIYRNDELF